MRWAALAFQVVPPFSLAALASAVGALWLANAVPSSLRLVLLLLAALAYVGLLALRKTPGWGTAMLIGFGGITGLVLGQWFPVQGEGVWGSAVALGLGLLGLAFLVGRAAGSSMVWSQPILWGLSWIYLAGWIGLALWAEGGAYVLPWAGLGLVVFSGLAAGWSASLDPDDPASRHPGPAADAYMLGLNLVVAARLVIQTAST